MRVKLKDPLKLFDEVLGNQSLRGFCLKNKINYSAAKQWRRGDHLLPKDIFDKLISNVKNKEYFLRNIEFIKDNWGKAKGG